jgi:hypothetical protein
MKQIFTLLQFSQSNLKQFAHVSFLLCVIHTAWHVAYYSFQPRHKSHLHLVEISDAKHLPEESDKNHKRFGLLVQFEVQASLISCDFYLYDFALMWVANFHYFFKFTQ